jgi:hypothetical protein
VRRPLLGVFACSLGLLQYERLFDLAGAIPLLQK